MYERLRLIARFVDQKIGWHRVGFVLSITIIGVALFVLARTLHDIDLRELLAAIKAVEVRNIVIAGAFVSAAYFTLTFYDLFALRTIGRDDVPYRIAALGAFTSYSIGHNVGASAFTGGAVRYRVYSAWGLSAIEVAKLCFIAGLTFWLGNIAVLGLGVAFHPEAASAVDQLPSWLNRVVALIAIAALCAYVAWVWSTPRIVGRNNWEVALPSGSLTLLQIVIGIIDLACCAAAMYMLVPNEPHLGFITVGVIFVAATLLGFASHSPGGLGVFDAAMLVALWQYDKQTLLAGLLIFRLLYYVVPFALALTLLGLREVWISIERARKRRAAHAPPIRQGAPEQAKRKVDAL